MSGPFSRAIGYTDSTTPDRARHSMPAMLFLILVLLCIQWTSRALIDHHAGYIYAIWYFYFLLVCITVGIGELGSKFGAIDAKGNLHGQAGSVLSGLLTFAFALNEDLMTALVLIGLTLLPQVLTYIFGGVLSGVGAALRDAGHSICLA